MEQEEYTKDEINWSYVEFVDNQDVLDLIEKVRTHSHSGSLCQLMWRRGDNEDLPENNIEIHFQKPGGIIALLDEAWYVTPACNIMKPPSLFFE